MADRSPDVVLLRPDMTSFEFPPPDFQCSSDFIASVGADRSADGLNTATAAGIEMRLEDDVSADPSGHNMVVDG